VNVLAWLADVEADLMEHLESPGPPHVRFGWSGGETMLSEREGALAANSTVRIHPATPKVRLWELLIKLRVDQLERQEAWKYAVSARAKVYAERARNSLTEKQVRLIAEADAGRLLPMGQDAPDGQWVDGLKEIDPETYVYSQHRGNPESPACRTLAENELKSEDAPEWRRLEGKRFLNGSVWRFRTTPWHFVMRKLHAERAMPFTEVELFEAVRLVQLEQAEQVALAIRRFVAQQDDSGYTNELLAVLWAQYRADAEAMRLEKPDETPVGGQGGDAVSAGRGAAVQQRDPEAVVGENRGDTSLPTVSRSAWVVLKRLVKSPTPLHRRDFAGKPDPDDQAFLLPSDEETIGDYLNELIEKRYATRPEGPRKGATATESGRRYVADHTEDPPCSPH